jgi:drug/metabolite transporter (DMT)-like permease
MVPLIGLIFRKKVKPILWFCIAIATVGMYFLCVTESGSIGLGDLFLIICALLFAIQIMIVDHFVKTLDGVRLSLIQFGVAAIISTVGMFIFEKPDLMAIKDAWFSIFYAGVLSSGVAFTLQVVAQKNLNPTVASLIMSLESVFAALTGAVFGERLTSNEILGCALVFLAIILAQLPVENLFKRRR